MKLRPPERSAAGALMSIRRDLDRLLGFVRAKFDAGADRLALAQRMLLVSGIDEFPAMLRPLTRDDLVAFFEAQARAIVRKG